MPRHVAILGMISLLTATSSAMVYGLLPVFLVKILGASMASVGFLEGIAEGMMALARIVSGLASDWMGRRKPLVLLGYAISAVNKVMFPLAGAVSTVLAARVIDRIGKGLRDAPRDAFMTDVTPARIRASGFGLRLAFYTTGFVIGPLAAMGLMALSGDDFRLVFWIAVIPAVLAIGILLFGITEKLPKKFAPRLLLLRRSDFALFTAAFWWAVAIASLLSLARFSHAFLILKAHSIGIDAAFVPIMLVLMHVVYAVAAYPFGVLADSIDRRLSGIGAVILIAADIVFATATVGWVTGIGAGLWGLQMAVTQCWPRPSPMPRHRCAARRSVFDVGLGDIVASAAAALMVGGAFGLWLQRSDRGSTIVAVSTGMVVSSDAGRRKDSIRVQPLMQISGRSRATRRAKPACSAAATTAPTSL